MLLRYAYFGFVFADSQLWIFDTLDGSCRILKSRSGHSQPPTKIRFYAGSAYILSGSRDKSLRYFATSRDQRTREFSQGQLASKSKKLRVEESTLKLPPITTFDFRKYLSVLLDANARFVQISTVEYHRHMPSQLKESLLLVKRIIQDWE